MSTHSGPSAAVVDSMAETREQNRQRATSVLAIQSFWLYLHIFTYSKPFPYVGKCKLYSGGSRVVPWLWPP